MQELKDQTLLKFQAYLNGAWVDADDGARSTIRNPATGAVIGEVAHLGGAETRRAILAAEVAGKTWRRKTAAERAAIMRRWYDALLANQEDLAFLLSSEQGKPLAEARGEIAYAAAYIDWFAEEGKRAYGELIPANAPDRRFLVNRQAIGVCAAITPWNFPTAMLARKVAAALAAGCTMVAKPAPQTPFSALALALLGERAGVPAGVFSVLPGDAVAIGGEMCANPVVRKLSFTGSTATGVKLMTQCAPTIKKLSLELGGNAPFIVFDDADLDAAVAGAMASKYRNSGQTCVCANRFLVQDGIYDAFAARLATAVKELKVGVGTTAGVTQGPLIDEHAVHKVEELVAEATAKGARALCGGQRHALGGTFYEPTILVDARPDMRLAREEIFGPVAPIFRFSSEAEAVALANDTEYGLAAYFYTRDLGRAWRISEALDYGMVGLNTGLISSEVAPFGGIKSSGLGREGARHGLDDYLEIKYVCMAGLGS